MAADTRDRILDALEKLLLVSGVAQVTLEGVAAEAGVSKGGLLYHFPSKEALLAAMVRRLGERSDQQLDDAVAGGTTVTEFYLQIPDANESEELSLFRSIIAALRTVDGQHDEIQKAVTHVMRSWDKGPSDRDRRPCAGRDHPTRRRRPVSGGHARTPPAGSRTASTGSRATAALTGGRPLRQIAVRRASRLEPLGLHRRALHPLE